eukprot:scaffold8791_cov98-Isochrysis_galbana.AAC.4
MPDFAWQMTSMPKMACGMHSCCTSDGPTRGCQSRCRPCGGDQEAGAPKLKACHLLPRTGGAAAGGGHSRPTPSRAQCGGPPGRRRGTRRGTPGPRAAKPAASTFRCSHARREPPQGCAGVAARRESEGQRARGIKRIGGQTKRGGELTPPPPLGRSARPRGSQESNKNSRCEEGGQARPRKGGVAGCAGLWCVLPTSGIPRRPSAAVTRNPRAAETTSVVGSQCVRCLAAEATHFLTSSCGFVSSASSWVSLGGEH